MAQEENNVLLMNLTPASATQLVRKIANEETNFVFFTTHAEQRMTERRITRTQILRCLRHGALKEGPCRGTKGNWEMSFEVMTAGEAIVAAVALDYDSQSGNHIVVITAYRCV